MTEDSLKHASSNSTNTQRTVNDDASKQREEVVDDNDLVAASPNITQHNLVMPLNYLLLKRTLYEREGERERRPMANSNHSEREKGVGWDERERDGNNNKTIADGDFTEHEEVVVFSGYSEDLRGKAFGACPNAPRRASNTRLSKAKRLMHVVNRHMLSPHCFCSKELSINTLPFLASCPQPHPHPLAHTSLGLFLLLLLASSTTPPHLQQLHNVFR
jgi:hypothetical protein